MEEKIIKTAAELFFQYGIRSVSVDDVCAQLRISKKSFYAYFKSKESLIEQTILFMRAHKKMNPFDENSNVVELLAGKLSLISKYESKMNDKHANLFYDLKKYYPQIYDKYITALDEESARMMKLFMVYGEAQGRVRSDIDIDLMATLLSRLFRCLFIENKQFDDISTSKKNTFIVDVYARVILSEMGLKEYNELICNKISNV